MGLISWPRLTVDDVRITSFEQFHASLAEIVSIGYLLNKLAALLPVLRFLFLALFAVFLRLVLAFVNQLSDFSLFLLGVVFSERLVVLFDQPFDLFTVELHHLIRLRFARFHAAFAVELVLFGALHVGVIAQLLVIFQVPVGNLPEQLTDLSLGKRRSSSRDR